MNLQFFLNPLDNFTANINVILSIPNGRVFRLDTELQSDLNNWDPLKQRPSNIYTKNSKRINASLDTIRVNLLELNINQINEQSISDCIKNSVTEETDQLNNFKENSLLFWTVKYISKKANDISHNTLKRYCVFKNFIRRFDGYVGKRHMIHEIDNDYIETFIEFSKKELYGSSTIYRTVDFIKTILKYIEQRKISTHLNSIVYRKVVLHTDVIALTEAELDYIQNCPVPHLFQTAKDWLLISCYTGQRFSDFMRFNKTQLINISNKMCISFTQKKTKKRITLPLHPQIRIILAERNLEFPEPMRLDIYNKHIREIAKLCKINEKVTIRKRIGFKSKIEIVEKWEALTSHVGRRSFATNFYGKIPTPLLMQATGHSSEQTFIRYTNPIDKQKIESLSNYFEKIHKEGHAKTYAFSE